MDLFSQQYNSLLSYAGAIIRNRNLTIDASDIVNDAYIKFIESGKEYNRDYIKTLILRVSDVHKVHQNIHKDSYAPKKQASVTGEFCCKKCKEIKQVNEFYTRLERGIIRIDKTCKKCRCQRRREIGYSRTAVSYISTTESRKRDNNRQKNNIKELNDVYIKSLLRSSKIEISEENIEKRRTQILDKRGKRLRFIHKGITENKYKNTEYQKRWYNKNREKHNANMRNRCAKKKAEKIAAGILPKKPGRPFKYDYPEGITLADRIKLASKRRYEKNKKKILACYRKKKIQSSESRRRLAETIQPKEKKKRGRPFSIQNAPLTQEERSLNFEKARQIINQIRKVA